MAETTRHREAFGRYWELGAVRSIELLREVLEASGRAPSLRTLYEWSRRYQWQRRIHDLERDARASEDEARRSALREMHERQAREALFLQQRGAEWLAALGPDEASPEAAIRAIVEGAKLERLARGEATERTEQRELSDRRLQELSDDELDALLGQLATGVGREGAPGSR